MKQTVILFYKFTDIADADAECIWQHEVCEQLSLKGRIIVADNGINGTLAGTLEEIEIYKELMSQKAGFVDIVYKTSESDDDAFPRLSVKVRAETVTLGVGNIDMSRTGTHLSPEEWHELIQQDDVVVIDARNNYESAIGKFEGAIAPDVRTFKELPQLIDSDLQKYKKKKVAMYCTGGIRCEPLSAYMKEQGFQEVYQLEGGIVKYGEQFGNKGLWKGKCYVFDNRISVDFGEDYETIGECLHCAKPASDYQNCANTTCNRMMLQCPQCLGEKQACSDDCAAVLSAKIVVA